MSESHTVARQDRQTQQAACCDGVSLQVTRLATTADGSHGAGRQGDGDEPFCLAGCPQDLCAVA